jgi:hypothetical protein
LERRRLVDDLIVRAFAVVDLRVEVLALELPEVFFLLDVECDVADFWLSEGSPDDGASIISNTSTAAMFLPDSRIWKRRRDIALIDPL